MTAGISFFFLLLRAGLCMQVQAVRTGGKAFSTGRETAGKAFSTGWETAGKAISTSRETVGNTSGAGTVQTVPSADAVSIRITDVRENRYREPLDLLLSAEEVKAFNELEVPDPENGCETFYLSDYYCLHFEDAAGKDMDVWLVDAAHVITDSRGRSFAASGSQAFQDWIMGVEKNHGINYASVYKRTLGKDYFYELENAGEAAMKELPSEDRTGLAEKTFDEMETGQIAEKIGKILKSDAVIDPEQTDAHYCWRLLFYGQNGKILYEFEQDAGGAVYENHYRIHSPELEDYFNELISQTL